MADRYLAPLLGSLLLVFTACQPADRGEYEEQAAGQRAEAEAAASVVDVVARDFAFEAPDSIPSGWVTLRLENAGEQEHFLYLGRLPEGATFEDYQHQVVAPFDSLWQRYQAGELDKSGFTEALMGEVPEWYGSAELLGGPGLVAPGRTAETTVKLPPGEYWMECYVKTPEGEWHTVLGMLRPLTVTEEASGASPPDPDVELRVANGAIEVDGNPGSGKQTVAVHFGKRPPEALSMGNDVHLARLEQDVEVVELTRWMDWWKPEGLRAPAPAEFLGGTQDMPEGHTAYFTVTLEPGRYAWVMEAPTERSAVKEFTVE